MSIPRFYSLLFMWVFIFGMVDAHADDLFFDSPHGGEETAVEEEEKFPSAIIQISNDRGHSEIIVIEGEVGQTTAELHHIIQMRQPGCDTKANFFHSVIEARGEVGDAEEEMNKVLQALKDEWEKQGVTIPHHLHVDLQRWTRDAYRLSGDDYRVQDATKYSMNVFKSCMELGF